MNIISKETILKTFALSLHPLFNIDSIAYAVSWLLSWSELNSQASDKKAKAAVRSLIELSISAKRKAKFIHSSKTPEKRIASLKTEDAPYWNKFRMSCAIPMNILLSLVKAFSIWWLKSSIKLFLPKWIKIGNRCSIKPPS